MVEVEIDHASVVAADSAASPRFGEKCPPDLLVAARYRLAHAPLATPPLPFAPPIEPELDGTVPLAKANTRGSPSASGWSAAIGYPWGRRFNDSRHEHMFVCQSDGTASVDTPGGARTHDLRVKSALL